MHDLTFAKEIITALNTRKNSLPNGSRITSVNAALSPLSHVKPETLTETFRAMAKDTEFGDVALNIKTLGLEIRCRACKHSFFVDKPTTRCVKCNDSDLDIVFNREFSVDSIDIEKIVPRNKIA
ncbi:MAG: hydrogenase maturation nickel metallochaperone HypA [Candidatus Omnitrophota bacterium]